MLGLVVDDTTHFLYRFREALGEHGDAEQAVRDTLATTGVAITTTTLVLGLGFSVLALASVKSVAYFGGLAAAAMGVAWLADLFLLPALLVTFNVRRL